jgi:hypothetical protein
MGKKTAKWSLVILSTLVIYTALTVSKKGIIEMRNSQSKTDFLQDTAHCFKNIDLLRFIDLKKF